MLFRKEVIACYLCLYLVRESIANDALRTDKGQVNRFLCAGFLFKANQLVIERKLKP